MRLPDELLHRITGGGFRMGAFRGDMRNADRIPIRRKGTLFRISGMDIRGAAIPVLVRELSATGVGVVSPEPLVPAEEFLLRLPGSGGEVSFRCQTVRCEQTASGSRLFTIGALYRGATDRASLSDLWRSEPGQAEIAGPPHDEAERAAGDQRRTLSGNFIAK